MTIIRKVTPRQVDTKESMFEESNYLTWSNTDNPFFGIAEITNYHNGALTVCFVDKQGANIHKTFHIDDFKVVITTSHIKLPEEDGTYRMAEVENDEYRLAGLEMKELFFGRRIDVEFSNWQEAFRAVMTGDTPNSLILQIGGSAFELEGMSECETAYSFSALAPIDSLDPVTDCDNVIYDVMLPYENKVNVGDSRVHMDVYAEVERLTRLFKSINDNNQATLMAIDEEREEYMPANVDISLFFIQEISLSDEEKYI